MSDWLVLSWQVPGFVARCRLLPRQATVAYGRLIAAATIGAWSQTGAPFRVRLVRMQLPPGELIAVYRRVAPGVGGTSPYRDAALGWSNEHDHEVLLDHEAPSHGAARERQHP